MTWRIEQGDALEVMRGLPDNSVDAVITDPPYHRVKSLDWDRQWKDAPAFLAWVGELCEQWQRVLRPNGSLYCFASPRMAARVEVEIGKRFEVVNRITWRKPPFSTKAEMFNKEDLRSFFPASEAIIFAEHFGADNIAKGEAGYAAKCDELRGFVFEPLRAYLDGEREAAGLTPDEVNVICGFREKGGMAGRHWFNASQFAMPTEKSYLAAREATGRFRREYEDLRREYEDLRREYEDLRREYEDLRREYEDLRRPFSVTADVPYTDVWDFATVQARKGKHVCEKPLPLMLHIIRSSTREGATVLDCFSGSASTGEACLRLGRSFIGVEKDLHWVEEGRKRLASVQQVAPVADFKAAQKRHEAKRRTVPTIYEEQLPLFAAG